MESNHDAHFVPNYFTERDQVRTDRHHNGKPIREEDVTAANQPRVKRTIAARATAQVARARRDSADQVILQAFLKFVGKLLHGEAWLQEEQASQLMKRGGKGLHLDLQEWIKIEFGNSLEVLPCSIEELAKRLQGYIKDLKSKYQRIVAEDENAMSSFLERIPALFERLHRLSASPTGETPSLLREVSNELRAEILNVVRGAAARAMPAEFGEGIADADVDRLEEMLLNLGRVVQQQWTEEKARGTLSDDLSKFLRALQDYDPESVTCDFALLHYGARLLVMLSDPASFFGLFAQLNVYAVIDHLMSREEFIAAMQRIAAAAEGPAQSRQVREMVAKLNEHAESDADKLPTARRLSSYCLGNLIFAALDYSLSDESLTAARRVELLEKAVKAADHVAANDSAFVQVAWYRLAVAAATMELWQNKEPLAECVRKYGVEAVVEMATMIATHFQRPALAGAVQRHLAALTSK